MKPRVEVLAPTVASCLIGPVAAGLYETGHLALFGGGSLGDVWVVAGCAAVGAALGVLGVRRGAFVGGILSVISNTLVLGLYGFLASFFTLGGSR